MASEILKRKIKDGWGVTHERGTKVVKGYYFEKINNNILNYRLVKNVIACVPFLSVKHMLLVDIYTDLLQLTENDYLDILSIYMKIKNVNWIILIIISLDYAYDTFSKIQRIQSINKQTEYDNLVLEEDILSKKN
jgi:hypothetical protein